MIDGNFEAINKKAKQQELTVSVVREQSEYEQSLMSPITI